MKTVTAKIETATTAPLEIPPRITSINPAQIEFLRLPPVGQRCPITGMSRAALNGGEIILHPATRSTDGHPAYFLSAFARIYLGARGGRERLRGAIVKAATTTTSKRFYHQAGANRLGFNLSTRHSRRTRAVNLRQPCVMALLPAARFNWFAMKHRWQRRMAFPSLHLERAVPHKSQPGLK